MQKESYKRLRVEREQRRIMEDGSNCNGGMGLGEENSSTISGLMCSPSMMMMPLVTSHHHHHHHNSRSSGHHHPLTLNPNANTSTSTPFLLTPCTNRTTSSSSSIMLENNTTNRNIIINNNNNNTGLSFGCCFMETDHNLNDNNINNNNDGSSSSSFSSSVKAKIMAHPHYPRLLAAYVNCQKVGAPPEVVARLDEACAAAAAIGGGGGSSGCVGEDPALDQFMEAYCEMLIKYEQELSKPFKEAMFFFHNIERQFKALTVDSPIDLACKENTTDRNESSEDDIDLHNNNNNNSVIDPQAEDRELKGQLLRKYSGYLGSLKQEFMKKRKKGKLPKEARQQLLDWWSRHYKWPYPSESQKLALAESTGLDQKQINNWFINQRKRHWKPSEDMQFVVMDPIHPHYFMDSTNVLGNPYSMDFSHTML